ncbi:Protein of unknown function [Pyronema omphalodes CBS 100304]|uniref:Uncharacterized protein n=1 Tax=Pyronema omphalodes (strain CBS 100304) TaxID=1076935 RepID=U4KZI5_PYROM|nr:Protein of unknown function [Pyronema omphalodes CBS 100304]
MGNPQNPDTTLISSPFTSLMPIMPNITCLVNGYCYSRDDNPHRPSRSPSRPTTGGDKPRQGGQRAPWASELGTTGVQIEALE